MLKDSATIWPCSPAGNVGVFPVLDFADSDTLEVGDIVLAISRSVSHSVDRDGIVSLWRGRRFHTSPTISSSSRPMLRIDPGDFGDTLVDMSAGWSASTHDLLALGGFGRTSALPFPPNMVRMMMASAKSSSDAVLRPWLGANCGDSPRPCRQHEAQAAGRCADRRRDAGQPGRAGRSQGRRRHYLSTTRRSMTSTPSIIASPPSRSAAPRRSSCCATATS